MTSKKVSIILPTHNGSRYIRESVDSCLAQTHTNFELILVDDFSTDETPRILDEYAAKDPRVKVLHLNPNRKLPGALNAGFNAAAGEYLTWTSDDNNYAPKAIERMVEYLDSHPDVGLVYCNYANISDSGQLLGPGDVGPPEQLAYFGVVGACFMYRSSVRQAVGDYDETLFCAEDYDYWLRIASRFNVAWLPEELYFYRRHDKSLTSTQRDKMLRSMRSALIKSLPKLRVPRSHRARGYLVVSSISYRQKKLLSAVGNLCRAFSNSPGTVIRHLSSGLQRRGLSAFDRGK